MKSARQIREKLRRHKPRLAEEYGVRSLGLFGSYARGDQGPRSDIDILVEFNEPIGLLRYVHLQNHLEELLGAKVDLVMKSALKPRIGQNILKEVVSL